MNARERLCCMAAASLPDIDGLGIVLGEKTYQNYHHVLSHNLPFAIVLSLLLITWTKGSIRRRAWVFIVFAALVHLHLVMDYFGSGPLWPIYYFWPIDRTFRFVNPTAWPLFSWQNAVAAALLLGWTIVIARRQRRTPIELIAPRLDREWVAFLQARRG